MGGARTRQAADDDRRCDLLVEDLGMTGDQVLDQQTVLQQPEDQRVLLEYAGAVEATFLDHGAAQQVEARSEVPRAEVVEAGLALGGGHQRGGLEREL